MPAGFNDVLTAIGYTERAERIIRGASVARFEWRDRQTVQIIVQWLLELFKLASLRPEKPVEPVLFSLSDRISVNNDGFLRGFIDNVRVMLPQLPSVLEVSNKDELFWNGILGSLLESIDVWSKLSNEFYVRGMEGLYELPFPIGNKFYCAVKEFHPRRLDVVHPLNERQLSGQRRRPSADLLKIDPNDPISGQRFWRPGDRAMSSGIRIQAGHHRLYELYRRYINGILEGLCVGNRCGGDLLIEFVMV